MRRLVPLVGLLAVAVFGASPASATVRDLGAFPGFLRTDGETFLSATSERGSLRLFGIRTRTLRTVRIAPGCFQGGVGPRVMVLNCSDASGQIRTGRTLDVRTGRIAALPPLPPPSDDTFAPRQFSYEDIGTVWARLDVFQKGGGGTEYVNLRTGAAPSGRETLRTFEDLSAASLFRPLCSPIRRKENTSLAVFGRRAAAVEPDDSPDRLPRVVLQRCGADARVVRRCPSGCAQLVLDDRTLAWVEATSRNAPTVTIHVRSLRTGRTRRILRLGRADRTQLQLVGHELYASVRGRLLQIST